MSTDTHKYGAQVEQEPRHSALQEFSRDERRPAVLLLGALVIAASFFAMGILVGRWSNGAGSQPTAPSRSTTKSPPAPSGSTQTQQPTPAPPVNAKTTQPQRDSEHRFALLIATYNAPEDAQPLIKSLEKAGYKEIRTSTPRAGDPRPKFSVLVGRYTRDEARQAAERLRASADQRLKNVRVVEDSGN
jgi:cell division septation protein DedD